MVSIWAGESDFIFFGSLALVCSILREVNELEWIPERCLGAKELARAQSRLATQPGWSRWRLSRELARRWDWRTATGQLKDLAALTLLLKLAQRGG